MANTDFLYLYPYSAEEAQRRNEIAKWRLSHRENIACKEAIEAAIRRDFDGMHLGDGCAKSVIAEFGYKRIGFVLANTLRELSHDGRFSQSNKLWGKKTFVPPDKNHNYQYAVSSHPAVLDGFINEFRKAYAELGLFDVEQCEIDTAELDYEGKVLVMCPDTLCERYWEPKYQLWYAHDGFGCSPHAIGRSIRCTCLGDGEMARWNRSDFIGPIKKELLPDWAKNQAERLKHGQQVGKSELSPPIPEVDWQSEAVADALYIAEVNASFENKCGQSLDEGPKMNL